MVNIGKETENRKQVFVQIFYTRNKGLSRGEGVFFEIYLILSTHLFRLTNSLWNIKNFSITSLQPGLKITTALKFKNVLLWTHSVACDNLFSSTFVKTEVEAFNILKLLSSLEEGFAFEGSEWYSLLPPTSSLTNTHTHTVYLMVLPLRRGGGLNPCIPTEPLRKN